MRHCLYLLTNKPNNISHAFSHGDCGHIFIHTYLYGICIRICIRRCVCIHMSLYVHIYLHIRCVYVYMYMHKRRNAVVQRELVAPWAAHAWARPLTASNGFYAFMAALLHGTWGSGSGLKHAAESPTKSKFWKDSLLKRGGPKKTCMDWRMVQGYVSDMDFRTYLLLRGLMFSGHVPG